MFVKDENFLYSEDAQSTVLGFVLIMGIVLSASSIYFSNQVPEWTEDSESMHTADVADDFSELKMQVDGIKGVAFERSTNIKMSPDKVPILGMTPPGSSMDLNPDDSELEIIVPVEGGGGGSDSWVIPYAGFSDYYDEANSSRVSVSATEVTLSSPTTTNLILDNEELELPGDLSPPYIHYYDEVVIKNNSVLSVTNSTGVLRIYAKNITLDASSEIAVNGQGNPGGESGSAGSGYGYGEPADVNSDDGGGGAGYGGSGGDGGGGYAGYGGMKYGDRTSVFVQTGSGGGGGGNEYYGTGGKGGNGGGGIWLDAETITIEGEISTSGENGENGDAPGSYDAGGGGGGSGGGILIRGKDVTISSSAELAAKGGKGGRGHDSGDGGGGGAGGRIKVFYEFGDVDPDWTVDAGTGGYGSPYGESGDEGTYYVEQIAYATSPDDVIYYSSGYFVSDVYDTGDDSVLYGEMTWDATLNGQELVMKVRTDYNETMASATPWDDCLGIYSGSGENEIDLSVVNSVSPAAHRYIQFRAEFSTEDETKTPVLTRTQIDYSFPTQSPILGNASGSFTFHSHYLYYPNQKIVYEHGAVIQYQEEGGYMVQEPPIIISNESGIPAIRIALVDLTGTNYSYSGATSRSMKTTYQKYDLLADRLRYPDLTINITTDYPSIWDRWFSETLAESELGDSYFDLDVTANKVGVTLYGHGQGVGLYLEKTVVEAEI